MWNIDNEREKYKVQFSLIETCKDGRRLTDNSKEIIYWLLNFCKKIGAFDFELDFINPDMYTGQPFVNPSLLKDATVLNASITANEERKVADHEKPKNYYLIAKFDAKFINWFKEHELASWSLFNLDLFDSTGQAIANFSQDDFLINIYRLTAENVNLLKKFFGKHNFNNLKFSEMKKTFYISLASSNKKENLRTFQRKLSLGKYLYYDGSCEFFYSKILLDNSAKKKLDFDFSVFSNICGMSNANGKCKSLWESNEVLNIFSKLDEELKEKASQFPKRYRAMVKLDTGSNIGYSGEWLEIDSEKWSFSVGWNKATAKNKNGKKINLLKNQEQFKIGKFYKAKNKNLDKAVDFGIECITLRQELNYFMESIKRLCTYAKEHDYKIWMSVILE